MSDDRKDNGDASQSPRTATRKLRDRVSFFEKVWTGLEHPPVEATGSTPVDVVEVERLLEERRRNAGRTQVEHVTLRSTPFSSPGRSSKIDVEQMEKLLREERSRHLEHAQLEQVTLRSVSPRFPTTTDGAASLQHVTLKSTPLASPKKVVILDATRKPSFEEETLERTIEEGDLSTGSKVVKFEKITVKRSFKEITVPSRTPSEEHVLEDSAYHSHGNGVSKSSSVASLPAGKFPSDESLDRPVLDARTPSRENVSAREDWDSASNSSSKHTSGSDWYSEYKTQSFLHSSSKLDYVRSRSQYDSHIAEIRGELFTTFDLPRGY